MKACSTCGVPKAASEFQVRRASHDGLTAACKACLKDRDAARFQANRPMRQAQSKAYTQTPAGRAAVKRSHRKWIGNNRLKRDAHVAVNNAVRDGRLTKGPCEECGSQVSQAHHDDYSKPLSVRWLCTKHHAEEHHHG
jgi:hypothetical protein